MDRGAMERTYDIFEVLPDGDLEWRDFAEGHDAALARARELAAGSRNEFRVMHLPTNSIVAVFNTRQSPEESEDARRKADKNRSGDAGTSLRWRNFTRMQGFFRRASSAC